MGTFTWFAGSAQSGLGAAQARFYDKNGVAFGGAVTLNEVGVTGVYTGSLTQNKPGHYWASISRAAVVQDEVEFGWDGNKIIGIGDLMAALVLSEFTVGTGSTTSNIRTNATDADQYWDQMTIVVCYAATGRRIARRVTNYTLLNGNFDCDVALPGIPQNGDIVYLLAPGTQDVDSIAGNVWDELTSSHTTAGTFGEALGSGSITVDLSEIKGAGWDSELHTLEKIAQSSRDAADLAAIGVEQFTNSIGNP